MRGVKVVSLMCAATVLALAGCASLNLGSGTQLAAEKLVVEYATLKVIEAGHSTEDKQARAAKVSAIANDAKTIFNNPEATVATVVNAVAVKIATLNLSPADQMLADTLLGAVGDEIAQKVGAGVLKPDDIVTVNTVLGWVLEAASFPVS